MSDKVDFEIVPIEEETKEVAKFDVVEVDVNGEDEVVQVEQTDLNTNQNINEVKEEKRISMGIIKANLTPRTPVKEYAYSATFLGLGIGALVIAFTLDGYKVVGIICAVLAFLAAYSLFNTVLDAKKIQKILDSGECATIDDLMKRLKRKRKYDFLRNLGGMIRSGYVTGYEVVGDNEIRRVKP